MDKTKLKESLNKIREVIDKNIEYGETFMDPQTGEILPATVDPAQALDKLNECSMVVGLCAECYSISKMFLRKAELQAYQELAPHGHSPSVLNNLVKSQVWEDAARFEYAERLSAGLVHVIDALRSIISKLKQEASTV